MSVDLYAVCPCGSGKKIKFCKCKDSVHQLDEILQMIEGGQVVPALDRMNGILDENPQAAWVLAIRGRLLLDLREYDSLRENADRFIRLQPSNPLALTQSAAATLFAGELQAATEGILEALTESGQDVDSFVLDVASVLAYSLSQSGNYLTARIYATLGLVATDYEGGATAMTVLRSINSSPVVNGYLKQVPEPSPRPTGVPWAERFDEAQTLLLSNKVTLAENKFDNLRRTVSDSPAILGGLLTCAIWRGDLSTQQQLLARLSECDSLSHDERVRYRAMAAVIDPLSPELSVESIMLSAEVEKVDEIIMALGADSQMVDVPAESLQQFRVSEDDVPPKAAFQIADRDVPGTDDGMPAVEMIPESLGTIVVYGKQTDREARLEVMDVRRGPSRCDSPATVANRCVVAVEVRTRNVHSAIDVGGAQCRRIANAGQARRGASDATIVVCLQGRSIIVVGSAEDLGRQVHSGSGGRFVGRVASNRNGASHRAIRRNYWTR